MVQVKSSKSKHQKWQVWICLVFVIIFILSAFIWAGTRNSMRGAVHRDSKLLTLSAKRVGMGGGMGGKSYARVPDDHGMGFVRMSSRQDHFFRSERLSAWDSDQFQADTYAIGGKDSFKRYEENMLTSTKEESISTLSVDVDTSSYSYIRRQINNGNLPVPDAVRAEEMINYFDYNYQLPRAKDHPFETTVGVSPSPWGKVPGQKLIHVGIKGYTTPRQPSTRANLVFLLDVSGSMSSNDKLPLVKESVKLLLSTLNAEDHVAIVTYNSMAKVALRPTPVSEKAEILHVLDSLHASGGTGGAGGLKLAYELAENNFDSKTRTVNRVILASDGDFNVGPTSEKDLKAFIESKRKTGIFLSVLGFGMGNYKDSRMQTLANHGNGIAAYIDTINEAHKVLVEEAGASLFPIAKDVKIQVEFNPATVAEYRLIGYEKRLLKKEDFNNDNVDAAEIGSGHTVTAIYEITPSDSWRPAVDEKRYEASKLEANKSYDAGEADGKNHDSEYAYLKIRYKLPNEDGSKLLGRPILKEESAWSFQQEFDFATAVAGFAQILKGGNSINEDFDFDRVLQLAEKSKGSDEFGHRSEFIGLVRKASFLSQSNDKKWW